MTDSEELEPVESNSGATLSSDEPVNGCSLVNNYDWDKKIAYAVCMAESGGNPNAQNINDRHLGCLGSYGLMQIACVHTNNLPEFNPSRNMQKAYEVYQHSGWRAWGAFSNQSYLKYL